MAKKKAASQPADLHKSKTMVRLTDSARAMLEEMVGESRRPFTTEVQLAVEMAYAAFLARRRATGPGPAST